MAVNKNDSSLGSFLCVSFRCAVIAEVNPSDWDLVRASESIR